MKPSFSGDAARELALLADGIERMYADSLSLARLELSQRARVMARDLGRVGLFAVLLGLGYALLSVALALWLALWIGGPSAFLAVGAVNAIAGAVGLKVAVGRVRADS